MTADLASTDLVPSNADNWKTCNVFTKTITVQNTTQLKFKTENNQTIRKSDKPQSWFTLSALKACLVEHFLVCSQPLHWVHSFLAGLTPLLLWCSPAPNSLFTKQHSNQLSSVSTSKILADERYLIVLAGRISVYPAGDNSIFILVWQMHTWLCKVFLFRWK